MTASENLFATFNGPDLDRLIACLQKIRSEGLQVDKYTQTINGKTLTIKA